VQQEHHNIVRCYGLRYDRSIADRLPAPVMKDVEMSYEVAAFNGSLMKENVFRQNAGPEVDAAWESLGVNCGCPNVCVHVQC
jgi:hypothetical protein